MSLQTLTLQLDDITAGDYLPPAQLAAPAAERLAA